MLQELVNGLLPCGVGTGAMESAGCRIAPFAAFRPVEEVCWLRTLYRHRQNLVEQAAMPELLHAGRQSTLTELPAA